MLTAATERGIHTYYWAYDREHLLYLRDAEGDENWHLIGLHVATGVERDLTPFSGVQARVIDIDPNFPGEVLVALNRKDPRRHDVHRVVIRTGEIVLDCENPGQVVAWTPDADWRARCAMAAASDGGHDLLVRREANEPWRVYRHWGPDDQGHAIAFSPDGNTLYWLTSQGANAARVLSVELTTGAETVVASDATHDASHVFFHPTLRVPQAIAFERAKTDWLVVDPEVAPDFEALASVFAGSFRIVSRDLADTEWVIAVARDVAPPSFHRYERRSKKTSLLFSEQPELAGAPLAKMKDIAFPARDGLGLHGYLTLPPALTPERLPCVVLVHGGPWARDVWVFHPVVQWLANRGYAVLQINFRGSTGYGRDFLRAGFRQWGKAMQDDLVDGVDWAVAKGIVDPQRVGIMGTSYGGYAVLAAMAFTPNRFAAGVDVVGPSNLLTLLETLPPYWTAAKMLFKERVGDRVEDEAALRSVSPVFHCHRIESPLLIFQGASDPRVKPSESEQMVEAMRGAGKAVEYVVYAGEGHGFARPVNRLHCYAHAERFLARHLGGLCANAEPMTGHTGQVR
jgi:dipeptidyl aminopeptidase/acylaminoacyl peptidase